MSRRPSIASLKVLEILASMPCMSPKNKKPRTRSPGHPQFRTRSPGHLIKSQDTHIPPQNYGCPDVSKYGDLSQDEAELKATSLAEHFYKYLATLAEHVQVIVIENSDPPSAIDGLARIETFTGNRDDGRAVLLAMPA